MQTTAGGEIYRALIEQTLGMARAMKDTYVAGIEAGFDAWERQCRLLFGGPQVSGVTAPPNPLTAWMDVWQRWQRVLSGPSASASR